MDRIISFGEALDTESARLSGMTTNEGNMMTLLARLFSSEEPQNNNDGTRSARPRTNNDTISTGLTRDSNTQSSFKENEEDDNNNNDKDNPEAQPQPKYSCGHPITIQCFGDESFTGHECKACSWRKVFDVLRETRQGQAARKELLVAQLDDIRFIRRELGWMEFSADPDLTGGSIWSFEDALRLIEGQVGLTGPVLFAFNLGLAYKVWELEEQMRKNEEGAMDTIAGFMQAWADRWGEVTNVELDAWNEWLCEYADENDA